jgi:hypothetical protein
VLGSHYQLKNQLRSAVWWRADWSTSRELIGRSGGRKRCEVKDCWRVGWLAGLLALGGATKATT